MATLHELTLFSLLAYREHEVNSILPPNGWSRDDLLSREDVESGFAADVYRRGSEIVVAFRGTDDDSFLRGLINGRDWANNRSSIGASLSPD